MDNLVFSNMMHRPARTLVSILGIAIGVLLIVFTVGMANGTMRERAERESNVGAEILFSGSGSTILSTDSFLIPVTEKSKLEKIEGVQTVVPLGQNTVKATGGNSGSSTGSRLVDGITFPEYSEVVGISIKEGRVFEPRSDEAIIDTGFQAQKKLKIGDKLNMFERDFTIVGTYEPAAGARVKIPLGTMQNQLVGDESKVSSFLIKIAPGASAEQIAERIHTQFPNNQVLLTSQIEELYMQGFPAMNIFLNVIIGVAAVISALVILLTMYTTVTERTRQIGIMKSLGMSNGMIAWIVAQEALLISFCGILAGIVLTVLLRFVLTKVITIEVEIDPLVLFLTLIIGLAGGALGALYPAMKAARLDAVEALNYD
ncbi:MAG: ABC transporter permease [Pyrinomonadaceae bacterium]|nr:ABC transporter permease [Pyrinomonadaceae bacterium]